ncbi:restriction endonuclease subunit S [Teredinibacter turnerae]|uniref:restriction endonuclease subunit S n=1 Tax=Teredinibacter turnerae TaxID=2426 RepID=UPI00039D0C0C|nr:restriction endonuclease subunit S [Teredinibacter turnerae]
MGEVNKVPAIRFEGFSGEWKEKLLGEIGSLKNGMNFDKSALGHGHPFVNLQDVFGKNEVKGNNLGLAFSTEKQRKEYSLEKGDVLFIRSSVKPEGVGETAVVSSSLENTTYSGFIIRFRPNIEMDVSFNRFVYSTRSSRRQILASSTSSANSNINQDSLQRIQLTLPCKEEQTKIGNYFQQLDTLIAQHQKKHDKLLNLKKALLEKLFPKQGVTEPELRFKGFRGEWEERRLLSNFEKIIDFRGRTPKKLGLDWSDSGYLALSALNVKNGFIDYSADANFGNDELYDKWMSGNELHKNQVLFTTEAPMGNVAQVPDNNKYILSQRTIAFEVNIKLIEENFLAVMLRAPLLQAKLASLSSGGTAQGVSQKSLASVDGLFPLDIKEQTKIGNLFKQLDTLISQHQAQLKKLNNIKQACLEKMFV